MRSFVGRSLSSHKNTTSLPVTTAVGSHNGSSAADDFEIKEDWMSSKRLNSLKPRSSSVSYQNYDLEGIAYDGYGYTVRISAEPSEAVNEKSSRKHTHMMTNTRQEQSRGENERDATKTHGGLPSWRYFQRNAKRFSSATHRHSKHDSLAMEIVTRQSLEVRVSFHEPDERRIHNGWAFRNGYQGSARPDLDGEDFTFLSDHGTVLDKE
jgi:hypothetical protein